MSTIPGAIGSVKFFEGNLPITLGGETHEAPFGFVVGEPPENRGASIDALVLGGYGENKKAGINAVMGLSEVGVRGIYPLLPLDKFPTDEKWYTAVVTEGLHRAITQLDLFSNPKEVPTISHSAGATMWGIARNRAPEQFGNAELLAPVGIVGLDENWYGRSDVSKRHLLLARFIQNGLTAATYGRGGEDLAGYLGAFTETMAQFGSDIRRGRLLTKFGIVAKDLELPRAVIEHVASGYELSVTLGTRDVLPPEKEARRSLASANLINGIVNNSESVLPYVGIFREDISHVHFRMVQGVEQIRKSGQRLVDSYSVI